MHRIRFAHVLVLLVGFGVFGVAEELLKSAPAPKAPVGHIRVWHFAPSMKTPVSVSLSGGGASQPVILARAMVVSDLLNYRDVPPGQYKLSVRTAASDLGVSDASPEVLLPVSITVADKTFQTVVLQDQGASAKIFLTNDTTTGAGIPKGGKRLRIFNFAPGQDAALKIFPSNEVIADHIAPGVSEHMFSTNPGSLMLLMANKLRNGHIAEQTVEANFRSIDSISALMMFDRYGRLTLLSLEDGSGEGD